LAHADSHFFTAANATNPRVAMIATITHVLVFVLLGGLPPPDPDAAEAGL
jgi:hypothetical protein